MIEERHIKKVFDSKYIKLYDMTPEEHLHYYVASRKETKDLPAVKSKQDFKKLLPDAVSCIVVVRIQGAEPRLLLNHEYRYPTGQYLLSVPAGLIDSADRDKKDAVIRTALRELKEETGLEAGPNDQVKIVNSCLFSSPGMTDESNALVYIELRRDALPGITQDGAVGTEKFNGYELLTKKEAEDLLTNGKDRDGISYPVWTWAALMFFSGSTILGRDL